MKEMRDGDIPFQVLFNDEDGHATGSSQSYDEEALKPVVHVDASGNTAEIDDEITEIQQVQKKHVVVVFVYVICKNLTVMRKLMQVK